MVQRKKCKARKTLNNDALDVKIGVDTAVNVPLKIWKPPQKGRPNYHGSDSTFLKSTNFSRNRLSKSKTQRDLAVGAKRKMLSADFHAEVSRNFSDLQDWAGVVKTLTTKEMCCPIRGNLVDLFFGFSNFKRLVNGCINADFCVQGVFF